jgi:hypothetical protein
VPVETPQDAPVIGGDVGTWASPTSSRPQPPSTTPPSPATWPNATNGPARSAAAKPNCAPVSIKTHGGTRRPATRHKQLARHVRQEIKGAVNALYRDHPHAQCVYAQWHVAGRPFKARRMNAYLYAANLAPIPAHLAGGAARRGMRARTVTSAYRSQQCHRCPAGARANRPTQHTFCWVVGGHPTHADVQAAENLAGRLGDHELAACADRTASTALWARRHQDWQSIQRLAVVQPPAQLARQRASVNG